MVGYLVLCSILCDPPFSPAGFLRVSCERPEGHTLVRSRHGRDQIPRWES
jgi:hypothetical protein